MIGLSSFILAPIHLQSFSRSSSRLSKVTNFPFSFQCPKTRYNRKFAIRLKNGDGLNGDIGDDELKKDQRNILNVKWGDLLNPDPDNIFAVALTGLLAWAAVQVLGQLVFISFAILVAALKYSFIAALLIFILITLL